MKLTAYWESKHPHHTRWLVVEGPNVFVGQVADELVEAGWTEEPAPPDLGTDIKKQFSKPGTDIFGGWTKKEGKARVKEAHGILARYGVTEVIHYELDPMDLL